MQMALASILLLLTSVVVFIAKKSLEKLDTNIEPYYDFNVFFPKSGVWSVVFYLVVILSLTLIIFISIKAQVALTPA